MHYLLINNHRTFGNFYEDLLGASALSRRDGAGLQVAGNLIGNEMVMQHADFPEGECVSKARAKELGLTFTMLTAQEASDAAVDFISRRLGER